MKRFTIFESTVIGFLIGIVISTYIVFADTTGAYIGYLLNYVSLRPLVDVLSVPENILLLVEFLFALAVYMFYGFMAGVLIKKYPKLFYIVAFVVLLFLGGSVYEQVTNRGKVQLVEEKDAHIAFLPKIERKNSQYFGTEAMGDLNSDKKDDVAFILTQNTSGKEIEYYLAAAITVVGGKKGTNIVYLGSSIEPKEIHIAGGVIGVEYSNTNTKKQGVLFARVQGDNLELIKIKDAKDTLWVGTLEKGTDSYVFTSCRQSEIYNIATSTKITKEVGTSTHPFIIFSGKIDSISSKSTSTDSKKILTVSDIIAVSDKIGCY